MNYIALTLLLAISTVSLAGCHAGIDIDRPVIVHDRR
jgi:hypothetical protein